MSSSRGLGPNTGFELAIRELQFVDGLCLFVITLSNSLQNSQIKTFLLLAFLSPGKPQSFCLHFNLDNSLISYSKKCLTVHYFLAFV